MSYRHSLASSRVCSHWSAPYKVCPHPGYPRIGTPSDGPSPLGHRSGRLSSHPTHPSCPILWNIHRVNSDGNRKNQQGKIKPGENGHEKYIYMYIYIYILQHFLYSSKIFLRVRYRNFFKCCALNVFKMHPADARRNDNNVSITSKRWHNVVLA